MSDLADGVGKAVKQSQKSLPGSKDKAVKLKGNKWMADSLECYIEEL